MWFLTERPQFFEVIQLRSFIKVNVASITFSLLKTKKPTYCRLIPLSSSKPGCTLLSSTDELDSIKRRKKLQHDGIHRLRQKFNVSQPAPKVY